MSETFFTSFTSCWQQLSESQVQLKAGLCLSLPLTGGFTAVPSWFCHLCSVPCSIPCPTRLVLHMRWLVPGLHPVEAWSAPPAGKGHRELPASLVEDSWRLAEPLSLTEISRRFLLVWDVFFFHHLAPCQMGVHVLCFLACSFLHCLTAHGAGGGAPTWHFLSTSPQRLRHAPCFSATSFQQQCEPFDEPDKHLRTFRVASDRGCDSGHGSALMLLQVFVVFCSPGE